MRNMFINILFVSQILSFSFILSLHVAFGQVEGVHFGVIHNNNGIMASQSSVISTNTGEVNQHIDWRATYQPKKSIFINTQLPKEHEESNTELSVPLLHKAFNWIEDIPNLHTNSDSPGTQLTYSKSDIIYSYTNFELLEGFEQTELRSTFNQITNIGLFDQLGFKFNIRAKYEDDKLRFNRLMLSGRVYIDKILSKRSAS